MKYMQVGLMVLLVGCSRDNVRLTERIAYWQNALAYNVPIGSSKEKIMEWATGNSVPLNYLPAQNWLYANVEQVSESGIPFPCSQRNIIIKITLSNAAVSTSNEVSQVGSCV